MKNMAPFRFWCTRKLPVPKADSASSLYSNRRYSEQRMHNKDLDVTNLRFIWLLNDLFYSNRNSREGAGAIETTESGQEKASATIQQQQSSSYLKQRILVTSFILVYLIRWG